MGSQKLGSNLLWGPNSSLFEKNLGVGCSLPTVLYCAKGGVYGVRECLSLSYPFQCQYFLISLLCRNHSASFSISFRGNFCVCNCTFISSLGGGKLRILLCHHLVDSQSRISFNEVFLVIIVCIIFASNCLCFTFIFLDCKLYFLEQF